MTCAVRLRTLFEYRELIWSLALRDIKVRYKQSMLGGAWAILQPLVFTVLFTLVFSRMARLSSDGVPYPLFAFSALLPWSFFANCLTFAAPSLVNNQSLITKIYFPREVFPLASVLACLVDFALAAAVFAGMAFLFHAPISVVWLCVPGIILVQILFAASVCMLLSVAMVFFRDIRFLVPVILQLWMFASPVMYSLSMVPEAYRALYLLNPMAGIITAYREVLLFGRIPDLVLLLPSLSVSLVGVAVAYTLFKRFEMRMADVI